MATPYLSSLTRIRSVVQQQNHVMADHLRIPLLVLRRYYQTAIFFARKLASQPLLLYTIFWTLMLAATVTVAALSLEMGFSTAISPHMEIAEACSLQSNKASPSCRQCFRLPLDGPRDGLCVPASLFRKSGLDFAVPPIFAALVVTASALFVQGLGLWSY